MTIFKSHSCVTTIFIWTGGTTDWNLTHWVFTTLFIKLITYFLLTGTSPGTSPHLHLGYYGTPGGTQTPDTALRRRVLCSAELLGQINRATYLHYKVANDQNLQTFLDNLQEYLVKFDLRREQFEMLHCDLQIYFY